MNCWLPGWSNDVICRLKEASKVIIFHHSPCPDGDVSAWIVTRALEKFTSCKIIPTGHGNIHLAAINAFPDKNTDSIYIFVDIFPPLKTIKILLNQCSQILIIDHHDTAVRIRDSPEAEQLLVEENKIHIFLDMDRAGCQMCWDFFHHDNVPLSGGISPPVGASPPPVGASPPNNTSRPWFIDFIGERDLWHMDYPNIRPVFNAIKYGDYLQPAGFDHLMTLPNESSMIPIGIGMQRVIDSMISEMYPKFGLLVVNNKKYNAWFIECTVASLISEAGNYYLSKPFSNGIKPDLVALWNYNVLTKTLTVSMRGSEDKINLAEICEDIAKVHGGSGGGHKTAAAVSVPSMHIDDLFTPL